MGAAGDGITDDAGAIAKAYELCRAGQCAGNTVLFESPGRYATSPVNLLACNNSVTVIEPNATVEALLARADVASFWPVGPLPSPEPSQGLTSLQARPFVTVGPHAENVTLRGGGAIDAGGERFWRDHCGNWWCPPAYNASSPKAWRPFLLRIEASRGVVVQGVTLRNPGFWCLVPVRSRGVTVRNVTVVARTAAGSLDTPNTDGIEPMWSSDVHVSDVDITNGDDCITVKSGSRNVLVERVNCTHSHGITVGSVWYDDVVNVTYRDIAMGGGSKAGPRIKGRSQGNATIRDIVFDRITLDGVTGPAGIQVDMTYETPGSTTKNTGCVARNITFRGVTGTVAATASGARRNGSVLLSTHHAGSLVCLPKRPCNVGLRVEHVHLASGSADVLASYSSNGRSSNGWRAGGDLTDTLDWQCTHASLAAVEDTVPLPGSSCFAGPAKHSTS